MAKDRHLHRGSDEFDDDDLQDDLLSGGDFEAEGDVEDDDFEGGDVLTAAFPDDSYQVVDLRELAALEEDMAQPTLTFEQALAHLGSSDEPLAAAEYLLFSGLTPAAVAQVRQVWPSMSLAARRTLTDRLLELDDERLDLSFGPVFRMALDDADEVTRLNGVLGLVLEDEEDLLGRFVHMLDSDPSDAVRAGAAHGLGIYVLKGELDEFDPAQAVRAEQALLSVLTNPAEALLVQCRALESIAYSGDTGVRQLIEDAYFSPAEEKRISALTAMGRSADVHWRRLARAELASPNAEMRAQAAFACGELEDRRAVPALLRLLRDSEQLVRLAAIAALGHLGGTRARQALEAIMAGRDEVEAMAAEEALEEMSFYAGDEAMNIPLYDVERDEEDDDEEDDEDRTHWFAAGEEEEGEDDEFDDDDLDDDLNDDLNGDDLDDDLNDDFDDDPGANV